MTKTRFLPLVALFFSLFLGAVAQSCLAASSVDDDPVVEDVASQDGKTENFSLHGQATYVLQYKNRFNFARTTSNKSRSGGLDGSDLPRL